MHISEGVLSLPVLISGDVITAAGVYLGIKNLKEKEIPNPYSYWSKQWSSYIKWTDRYFAGMEKFSSNFNWTTSSGNSFSVWWSYNSRDKYCQYGSSFCNLLVSF